MGLHRKTRAPHLRASLALVVVVLFHAPHGALCACSNGYFLFGGNCYACVEGNYCTGDQRYACPNNTPYSPPSSSTQSQCRACSNGYEPTGYIMSFGVFPQTTTVGGVECVACSPGTYALSGATSCSNCDPGRYQPSSAQPSCPQCESGKYQPNGGMTACIPCDSGLVSAAGSTSCVEPYTTCNADVSLIIGPALPGRFPSDLNGFPGQHMLCQAGYTCAGGDACPVRCPAGKYQPSSGQTSCIDCPAGSYSPGGVGPCTACNTGQWSPSANIPCGPCPTGMSVPFSSSTVGSSYCLCNQNTTFYDIQNAVPTQCMPCDSCTAGRYKLGSCHQTFWNQGSGSCTGGCLFPDPNRSPDMGMTTLQCSQENCANCDPDKTVLNPCTGDTWQDQSCSTSAYQTCGAQEQIVNRRPGNGSIDLSLCAPIPTDSSCSAGQYALYASDTITIQGAGTPTAGGLGLAGSSSRPIQYMTVVSPEGDVAAIITQSGEVQIVNLTQQAGQAWVNWTWYQDPRLHISAATLEPPVVTNGVFSIYGSPRRFFAIDSMGWITVAVEGQTTTRPAAWPEPGPEETLEEWPSVDLSFAQCAALPFNPSLPLSEERPCLVCALGSRQDPIYGGGAYILTVGTNGTRAIPMSRRAGKTSYGIFYDQVANLLYWTVVDDSGYPTVIELKPTASYDIVANPITVLNGVSLRGAVVHPKTGEIFFYSEYGESAIGGSRRLYTWKRSRGGLPAEITGSEVGFYGGLTLVRIFSSTSLPPDVYIDHSGDMRVSIRDQGILLAAQKSCLACPSGKSSTAGTSTPLSACLCTPGTWGPPGDGGACQLHRASCERGQYKYSIGNQTHDAECLACPACPDGNYIAGCDGTGDQPESNCTACTKCNPGQRIVGCNGTGFLDSQVCESCRDCAQGQYKNQTCTGTTSMDTVSCEQCESCGAGRFMVGTACNGGGELNIPNCETCDACTIPGQVAMSPCTGLGRTSYQNCQDCAGCSSVNHSQFLSGGCNNSHPTPVCSPCSNCPTGWRVLEKCSGTEMGVDTACEPCLPCGANEYISSPCNGSKGSNNTCATCDEPRSCATGEYMSAPCDGTGSSPSHGCRACEPCPNGTYESSPCPGDGTNSLERVCLPCGDCGEGNYITGASSCPLQTNSAGNVSCGACHLCAEGTFPSSPCYGNGTSPDQSCTPCEGCEAGFFINRTCSPSLPEYLSRHECLPCATCAVGQYINPHVCDGNGLVPSPPGMCQACAVCGAGTYISTPCDGSSLSGISGMVCSAPGSCTPCADGEYMTAPCNGYGTSPDQGCVPCLPCAEGKYAVEKCDRLGTNGTMKRCEAIPTPPPTPSPTTPPPTPMPTPIQTTTPAPTTPPPTPTTTPSPQTTTSPQPPQTTTTPPPLPTTTPVETPAASDSGLGPGETAGIAAAVVGSMLLVGWGAASASGLLGSSTAAGGAATAGASSSVEAGAGTGGASSSSSSSHMKNVSKNSEKIKWPELKRGRPKLPRGISRV